MARKPDRRGADAGVRGTISDLQRFSLHDGPGIRTTVFLKGCNLHCRWCHNPEAVQPEPQLQFLPARCVGCGACLAACPNGAHTVTDGKRRLDRALCTACGACAAACFAGALTMVGREVSVAEVLDEVLADRRFYDSSGGGLTLSGGEPLLQADFAAAVLAACKAEGIHTAIETNLAWPWERAAPVLAVTDLVMLDIKMMGPAEHRRWTGAGNEQILDNARRLGGEGIPMIVRTPLIAGVNATRREIGRIADFISAWPNLMYYELLPYHDLGRGKCESLGLAWGDDGFAPPDGSALAGLVDEARARGIEVRCAGLAAAERVER